MSTEPTEQPTPPVQAPALDKPRFEVTLKATGRPSAYTQQVVETLVDTISQGVQLYKAAEAAGITYTTLNAWMNDPERKVTETIFDEEGVASTQATLTFSDAIKRAQEQGLEKRKEEAIQAIKEAFGEHWQAAAWYLERRYPEEFAQVKNLKIDDETDMIQQKAKLKQLLKDVKAEEALDDDNNPGESTSDSNQSDG